MLIFGSFQNHVGYCPKKLTEKWEPKKPAETASKPRSGENIPLSKARVSIYLNGCDVHWFYKADVHGPKPESEPEPAEPKDQKVTTWLWDLVPYFEIQVTYGRVIIGNSSLPYSMTFHMAGIVF